jgi:acetolactate synthase-1/2/3 large subunit
MMLTGAEILVRCLIEEGVEHVFGYPGGAVLFIYDELYKQRDKIQHFLVRHEQAAVHAADGYARSTDKIGVALVTSGPGATNAVTGIATAYMDSIPMIVISGQVATPMVGTDAFQEVDAVGVTRPCVKHNYLIKSVEDLAPTIKKAFYLAKAGRPGPVHVDIPKDVTMQQAEFHYPTQVLMRSYNPTLRGHPGQIKKAIAAIMAAKRPVVYYGGGVVLSGAAPELIELVRYLDAPCTSTLMGLGALPASDKRFLGMLGMHGTLEANMATQECDLLIAIGARFDDRVIGNVPHFEQNKREVIHIDIDPSSISKRVRATIPVVGDVKMVLAEMLKLMKTGKARIDSASLSDWWTQIGYWRERNSLGYEKSGTKIKPQYVIETLHKIVPDAIIVSDVGQHQMWVAQYFGFEAPKKWLTSGGLGTMGFGFPAAMGAALANPKTPVVCVTSEGSIQMCIQELGTCKQYGIPVTIISLNNGFLGMVRQWQEMFHGKRYSEVQMEVQPDFVKLTEAYGHEAVRIDKIEEVEPTLRRAFDRKDDSLLFIDVVIDREENVFPMIAAGKGLSEITLGEKKPEKAGRFRAP